jgi:hypothetical protein
MRSDLSLLLRSRERALLKLFLVVLILTVAASSQVVSLGLSREEESRQRLLTAFEAVSEAEEAGGDVSALIGDLRNALELINGGGEEELDLAESLIESVLAEAPAVSEAGAASARISLLYVGTVVGLVAVGAILVWRFGPRVFWSLWLRSKRGWRVYH